MEFLLVVRVWIVLWLKMIAWMVVVVVGKGVKRMLISDVQGPAPSHEALAAKP